MRANNELLDLMELCGHFLYHRRGGKRGQTKILRILAEQGDMMQRKIQDILDIKSGSLSEMVRKMEADGLILREKQEEDKRNIYIKLTQKGRVKIEQDLARMKKEEEILFNALSEEEQEQFYELCSKLIKSWRMSFVQSNIYHRRQH